MQINITENKLIELTEVHELLVLKTQDNKRMMICMRNDTFQFRVNGTWYQVFDDEVVRL